MVLFTLLGYHLGDGLPIGRKHQGYNLNKSLLNLDMTRVYLVWTEMVLFTLLGCHLEDGLPIGRKHSQWTYNK
jgi:hypothetical protein